MTPDAERDLVDAIDRFFTALRALADDVTDPHRHSLARRAWNGVDHALDGVADPHRRPAALRARTVPKPRTPRSTS